MGNDNIRREPFGTTSRGRIVERITLANARGTRLAVLTLGATLAGLRVADRHGRPGDVALGFDTLAAYESDRSYVGGTLGRVANRIGGSAYTIDGARFTLAANEGANQLHGGPVGLDRRHWEIAALSEDPASVSLRVVSPDGDQGHPGRLTVLARFTLGEEDVVQIDYEASTERATAVNLACHAYWNLGAGAHGDILDHVLQTPASRRLATDAALVPTGEILEVRGTAHDFTSPRRIGDRLAEVAPGYDVHYVLADAPSESPRHAATLADPGSGRRLEVHTTQPGFQLYTGQHLETPYRGLCLEMQHPPDAVHHAHFPTTLLRPGETYRHRTELRFSTEPGDEPDRR